MSKRYGFEKEVSLLTSLDIHGSNFKIGPFFVLDIEEVPRAWDSIGQGVYVFIHTNPTRHHH
jgi:hypothetical protein